MNSIEKDNIIKKGICCAGSLGKKVADMYLQGNRCADKEFQKLFLLTSYIETLGCYQAPVEVTNYTVIPGVSTNAQFQLTIPCTIINTVLNGSSTVELEVGTTVTSATGDNISTVGELLTTLLNATGFDIQYTSSLGCADGDMVIDITADCDTPYIHSTVTIVTGVPPFLTSESFEYIATVVTAGSCSGDVIESTLLTEEFTNCLTEEQADDIANQIAKICKLCDEH